MGAESTFVVKNNVTLFPRGPLCATLKARHGKKMAGHWVTVSTTVKGVPLIAVGHAWDNKDASCIISTCGETSSCQETCICCDRNTGCDNADTKMCPRPDIVNFPFTHCSVIDVHNKLHQFSLAVEKQWPTKCCWAKLLFGCLGNSVVNHHRLFACICPDVPGKDLTTLDFTGTISKDVHPRVRRHLPAPLRDAQNAFPMKRVADASGNTMKEVTAKQ